MYRTIIGAALATLALTGTAQAHAPLSLRDGRAAIAKWEDTAHYDVTVSRCHHARHGAVVCRTREQVVVTGGGERYTTRLDARDLARATSRGIRVTPLAGSLGLRTPLG